MNIQTLKSNLTRDGFINAEDLAVGALGFIMAGPLSAVGVAAAAPIAAVLSPLVSRASGRNVETWALAGIACFGLSFVGATAIQAYGNNTVETAPVVRVAQ